MANWNERDAMEWSTHGVFHGRITPEEWKAGGVWLLGNRWPDGYPGKTNAVFYKSWCTWPEKYTPGNYPRKNRIEQNDWEFVQVLDGCLECVVEEEGGTKRFPLEHMECVDVPPAPIHYWQFVPGKVQFASGISFFRQLRRPPSQTGAGDGYEFRLWSGDQLHRLDYAVNIAEVKTQFVEVLSPGGQLQAQVCTLTGDTREYFLGCREHLLLRAGVRATWCCLKGDPFGIVVYLQ